MPLQVVARQLVRSGTSIGASYREGIRARSNAELVSKMEMALQEAEESLYWLELLHELAKAEDCLHLINEVDQLIARMTSAVLRIKRAEEGKSCAR
jgi:four helix bundle protein